MNKSDFVSELHKDELKGAKGCLLHVAVGFVCGLAHGLHLRLRFGNHYSLLSPPALQDCVIFCYICSHLVIFCSVTAQRSSYHYAADAHVVESML